MKQTKILYWVFTILFSGFMIWSSAGGIGPNDMTIKFIHEMLGYPIYFIQFISIAKIIGCIVLLIPGLKTIKEWAYAGLFFDLIGAIVSIISVTKSFEGGSMFILLPIIIGGLSYFFWKKMLKAA